MVDQEFMDVLNDCINRLAGGQAVEECVRAYPQFSDRLRPMLQAATRLFHSGIDSAEIHSAQDRRHGVGHEPGWKTGDYFAKKGRMTNGLMKTLTLLPLELGRLRFLPGFARQLHK